MDFCKIDERCVLECAHKRLLLLPFSSDFFFLFTKWILSKISESNKSKELLCRLNSEQGCLMNWLNWKSEFIWIKIASLEWSSWKLNYKSCSKTAVRYCWNSARLQVMVVRKSYQGNRGINLKPFECVINTLPNSNKQLPIAILKYDRRS